MKRLLERIRQGSRLICDGAMGTQLQSRGLIPGECPEQWCLTHPDVILDIHRAYRQAGSDIVECNSFGGTHYKLRHFGLEASVYAINQAAAALARQVAGPTGHVLGSIGPTGAFMEPYGDETEADFYAAFRDQATALESGGADAVIIETMTALEECLVAIRAVREHTRLDLIASFTFDPRPDGGYASMMGVTPETFAEGVLAAGAQIIGANCGTGPDAMVRILGRLQAVAGKTPLIAMPNAGMPELIEGKTCFRESPEKMAGHVPALLDAGAVIIGGCCGTTPAHIAAFRRAWPLPSQQS